MRRPRRWMTCLVVGAFLLVACSSASGDGVTTTGPRSTTTTTTSENSGGVSIEDFAFGPHVLGVSVGETVTWRNDEAGVGHTVVSDDGLWASDTLSPGDMFAFTFDEPGTYTYFCSIHPSMTATITVDG